MTTEKHIKIDVKSPRVYSKQFTVYLSRCRNCLQAEVTDANYCIFARVFLISLCVIFCVFMDLVV